MMRIVFLLSAEERGLLLMGDERYEANYAVSTLCMQLRSESEEILECRRTLVTVALDFPSVYGGIQHETMRLPALGGSLFDPDRFSFLEGRQRFELENDPAKPLPIDNRTVLYCSTPFSYSGTDFLSRSTWSKSDTSMRACLNGRSFAPRKLRWAST